MELNVQKEKSDMYGFVSHTGNAIKGVCPHDCAYCYMKRWGKQSDLHLDATELRGGLKPKPSKDNPRPRDIVRDDFIFIGSSCDMFAQGVPDEWIEEVLEYCDRESTPRYLFQSKSSRRLHQFRDSLPSRVVLGTTIETNRFYEKFMGVAPAVKHRASGMAALSRGAFSPQKFETMVTVEPIMEFDLDELVDLILTCSPSWVNIGGNSLKKIGQKKICLPEPGAAEVEELTGALRSAGVKVHWKPNLSRILKRDIV